MDVTLGLGSLIGGLASSAGSVKAQKEANKANLEIARMNNEYNLKMAEKQNQWNLDQWQRENDYNTASAQRERLQEAGINPALAMSGNNAGTASSIQSAPMPQAQPVQVNPIDTSQFANYFAQLFDGAFKLDNMKLVNRGLELDNSIKEAEAKFKEATLYQQLQSLIENNKSTKAKTAYQNMQNSVFYTQFNQEYASRALEMQMQDARIKQTLLQNEGIRFQNSILEKQLSYFDQDKQLQYKAQMADIALKLAQRRLTDQQAIHEILKMTETAAKTTNIDLQNTGLRTQNRVNQKLLYRETLAQIKKMEEEARSMKFVTDLKQDSYDAFGEKGSFMGDFSRGLHDNWSLFKTGKPFYMQ